MDYLRRAMAAAFQKIARPTKFLSSMFQSPDANKFDTVEIVVDIKRNDESIAIDVVRGTGGRNNVNKRFTTKVYTPPVYDEFANVNENERLNRLLGQTEYSESSMAAIIAAIMDDQVRLQDKIIRSIELQAAQALSTGTVTLINNDSLDFKMKATHKAAPGVAWTNALGVPIDDMAGYADLNRKDGQVTTNMGIFGATAFKYLQNNAQFLAKAGTIWEKINNMSLRPPMMNADGATYHGKLTIGDYEIDIWTYPQYYLVPTGFGLANEGTKVTYWPADYVWLGNAQARFDLYYAGISKLVTSDPRLASLGLTQLPQTMRGDFHLYGAVDTMSENAKYGVKSAPVCVPTDIDSFCAFQVS